MPKKFTSSSQTLQESVVFSISERLNNEDKLGFSGKEFFTQRQERLSQVINPSLVGSALQVATSAQFA